jgi:hypothetical protein
MYSRTCFENRYKHRESSEEKRYKIQNNNTQSQQMSVPAIVLKAQSMASLNVCTSLMFTPRG